MRLARPREIGPTCVRASTALLNGSEERADEEATSHAGADRAEAERGRPASRRGAGGARGREVPGGLGGDVSPVASAVRWDEGRRCEAVEGARAGERQVEADRRRPDVAYRGAERGEQGKL